MKKALLFAYVWPEPFSSAAGVRSLELAQLLQKRGYDLTFVSPCKENEASEQIRRKGFATKSCQLNVRESLDFLKEIQPDLVVFDRFITEEQFGWLVRAHCPNTTLIIDTQDLHSLRRAREAHLATLGEEGFVPSSVVPAGEDRAREFASFYRVDGVLVVSRWEENLLLGLGLEPTRVFYCPFSPIACSNMDLGFPERKGFIFLGNLRHPPNLDSVKWIRKYLWPLVRKKISGATLSIVGAYPPKEISSWHGKEGIQIFGNHPSPHELLQSHRVMLAPLRYGAGIKGKILEAWSTGLPVVGSAMALEGMAKQVPSFSDKESFCEAACSLHEDRTVWQEWNKQARIELESFQPEVIENLFFQALDSIENNRERNRSHLLAEILKLSQLQSTKYFALWIEEKNKRGV